MFLCAGIVLGRVLGHADWRLWCAGIGAILYGASMTATRFTTSSFSEVVLSDVSFDRGIVYTASALGTALVAFALISLVADRVATSSAAMSTGIMPGA